MPKFIGPPAYPDLRLVALPPGTPAKIPLAQVTNVNGVSTFETLFSFEDAEGQPLAAAYPATYRPYLAVMQAPKR